MKAWVWWAIGLGTAAVAVTGVGIYEHKAHAGGAQCNVPPNLAVGHRYKIVVKAPAGQQLTANMPTAAQLQQQADQAFPGALKIVSVDPLPPSSVTIILDILPGASAQVLGSPQDACSQFVKNAPAGSALDVQDMGATPAGG